MVQYVNGFSCIMNSESKQLLIDFEQNFPKKNEKGFDSSNVVTESVSTLVMDFDLGQRLYQALKGVFEKNTSEE